MQRTAVDRRTGNGTAPGVGVPVAPIVRARIERFTYYAADAPSLRRIELDVEPGEFVVVTGPAGSGKTTLCYALTGVVPHAVDGEYEGDVRIAGQRLNDLRLAQVSKLCGFVLQSPEYQLFNLSVRDDVAFGPENLLLPPGVVRERVAESLAEVGMQGFEDRNSDLLSGGQMQRIVLACVLAMGSEVLILDQPAAELDPTGRARIYENLRRLNRDHGKTIVVVEDRLGEVSGYADRIVLMRDGEIERVAEPAAFFADPSVVDGGLRIPAPVRLHHYLAARGYEPGPLELDVARTAERFRPLLRNGAGAQPSAPASAAEPPSADPVVRLEELSHVYPTGHEALKDVDLSVGRGEFVAIIGENGAGKTTLARHLIGLLQPTGGRVRIDGRDIAGESTARISDRVGYLFQDPDYQIFSDSVFEEVAFALKIRGTDPEETERRVLAVLDELGLADTRDRHPYRLSRGQRQRLALASSLVHDPPVLVVDEPSTGLDYAETVEIMERLADRSRMGTTILFITHDIEMVLRYARRSIVVSRGRVALDVPTAELYRHLDRLDTAGILVPDHFELLRALELHTELTRVDELGDRILAAAATPARNGSLS